MMIQGSAVYAGARVYFVESLQTFARDLQAAQPTAFMSVPRLWKKFRTTIEGRVPPPVLGTLLAIPGARRWLRAKVRHALGLQHARLIGSGAAPLDASLIHWYRRLGIEISEAWGLTETCGLSCMNFPFDARRAGTIGLPVPGTELKLGETGELMVRSPGLFQGYFDDPAATAAAFDAEGFFRTGDQARWDDERGAWVITGRLGEPFKTAKGKFVVPQAIESRLMSHALVEQACVMGRGLDQPAAVVQLIGTAMAVSRDGVERDLRALMRQVNAAVGSHERLAMIAVSPVAWDVDSGLLTPTMKIRRHFIEQRFLPLLPDPRHGEICWLDA
jgi:long-chain acyl-CoA synthetase